MFSADDGLFPLAHAMLDPRPMSREQRVALLDKIYNEVLTINGGTYWLSAGPETDMLWDATFRTFVDGVWAATIVCSHAVCERTLASLMTDRYAVRPEPKNWRRWALGPLIDHMQEQDLVDGALLDEMRFVITARTPFNHWRDPLDEGTVSRAGMDAHLRGEQWSEGQDRHVAQLAYLCARTAVRVHFGDLSRYPVSRRSRQPDDPVPPIR